MSSTSITKDTLSWIKYPKIQRVEGTGWGEGTWGDSEWSGFQWEDFDYIKIEKASTTWTKVA